MNLLSCRRTNPCCPKTYSNLIIFPPPPSPPKKKKKKKREMDINFSFLPHTIALFKSNDKNIHNISKMNLTV